MKLNTIPEKVWIPKDRGESDVWWKYRGVGLRNTGHESWQWCVGLMSQLLPLRALSSVKYSWKYMYDLNNSVHICPHGCIGLHVDVTDCAHSHIQGTDKQLTLMRSCVLQGNATQTNNQYQGNSSKSCIKNNKRFFVCIWIRSKARQRVVTRRTTNVDSIHP